MLLLKEGHYISNTNSYTLAFSEYLLYFSLKKSITFRTQNMTPRISDKLCQILRFALDRYMTGTISDRFKLNLKHEMCLRKFLAINVSMIRNQRRLLYPKLEILSFTGILCKHVIFQLKQGHYISNPKLRSSNKPGQILRVSID